MAQTVSRSPEMWLVAYFLSRFGRYQANGSPLPSTHLKTDSWSLAYTLFYSCLGDGRTLSTFQHSLKNARDAFDSHLPDSGRTGWHEKRGDGDDPKNRIPNPLTDDAAAIFKRWGSSNEAEVWGAVSGFADLKVLEVPSSVIQDIEAELDPSSDHKSRTEGKKKVRISFEAERDPALRKDALAIHGTVCMACKFDFSAHYGAWGEGFAVVHHVSPLSESEGERETNPGTDLAVLCANCHAMVHRRKGTTLSLDELKSKLDASKRRVSNS